MLVALVLLIVGQVELGSASGVSEQDAQAALQEVRTAIDLEAIAGLRVHLQVLGGVTRVLLVLERMANDEIDARAECSAPAGQLEKARTCIREAMRRFSARSKPLRAEVSPSSISDPEAIGASQIVLGSLVGVSGALAIAGTVLAWSASAAHGRLEERPFGDARFLELEDEERRFGLAAVIVLSSAGVGLLASLLWAVFE